MDEKNTPKKHSPEDQLDALLEKFLAEDDSQEPAPPAPAPIPQLEDEHWLDDILAAPAKAPEIGPDELAVSAAGLTRPEDVQLEDILQEAKAEQWETSTTRQETFLDHETREAFDEGKALDEVFSSEPTLSATTGPIPQQPEEPVAQETVPEKAAPKNKTRYGLLGIPHIASTVIWLVLVASIGAALGQFLWTCATDVLAFGREDNQVTITVTEDETLDTLTEKLRKTGLIQYPSLFKLYANITDAMEDIDPGIYELNTLYDYHALVLMMQGTSNRLTVTVMIPEGSTCKQIFELLEKKGVCTASELEEVAANGELGDYWFLEGVERGNKYCLEGYLFPDTYEFYVDDKATNVLDKLLTNFENRFTENMVAKLDVLNASIAQTLAARGFDSAYIEANKMTMHKVVIVASMIEKETASVTESYSISSVIYNRLTNPGSFPFLNIDATLVYITGNNELTAEDKELDTPYNTYLYKGLIPGPISNPSLTSLNAALDPQQTGYYFYALDPETNRHHFSKTFEEHQDFLNSLANKEEN